jgi:hypothetical protein
LSKLHRRKGKHGANDDKFLPAGLYADIGPYFDYRKPKTEN